jgi:hypothetical protein
LVQHRGGTQRSDPHGPAAEVLLVAESYRSQPRKLPPMKRNGIRNGRKGTAMTAIDIASRPLSQADHRAHLRRAVIASAVGTTIEWYDFQLYNQAAALVFGKLFPSSQTAFQIKGSIVREAADAVLFARYWRQSQGAQRRQTNHVHREPARVRREEPIQPALHDATGLENIGDAIRAFYGIKENGSGNAKPALEPTQEPAPEQPLPQSEELVKIKKMLEFAKMSEAEIIAVLKAAQIKEAWDAKSLAEIPDAVLALAIEDWTWVETVAEQLKAKAA